MTSSPRNSSGTDVARTILAFDMERMKVGCVIIQAALGGDREAAMKFPNEAWAVDGIAAMRMVALTDEQLEKAIAMATELHVKNSSGTDVARTEA